MENLHPYDATNSKNPWLITHNRNELIEKDNEKLTAEYIWNKKGKERESLVDWVFNYYRKNGFPKIEMTNEALFENFDKIKKVDASKIESNNEISNSSSTGINIIKHFNNELFYKAKKDYSRSVYEVFNNDELFLKVLKNRMGYKTSKEDGTERPYVFGINDKMIIQGCISSGIASTVSQFKPVVAKYIYQKYTKKNDKILDYSAGWGARLLGALSLDLEYYGIDPLTSNNLNEMLLFFKGKGKIIKGMSEEINTYEDIPKVDFIFSSPPYFNMEIYNDDDTQSYNKFKDFNDWLNNYWNKTVINCLNKLNEKKYFSLCIVEKYFKYNLKDEMLKICYNNGLKLIETLPLKTSKSHLSSKRTSKEYMKKNDVIYILQK